jgi:3-hydroxyacyl-[acyl-carrier-protein] dehydratase
MLLNNLYTIQATVLSDAGDKVTATISLNKEHPIFKGHFPGNPILPGVCTVQIIRELLEKNLDVKLMLTRAGSIKYLGFINPVTTATVQFDLIIRNTGTHNLNCNATVSSSGNTLCSFKGEYEVV